MLGNQDSPVDEGCDVWKGSGGRVEDAEPETILGVLRLTRRRQDLLKASGEGARLAVVVRIVEVHESPDLQTSQYAVVLAGRRHLQRR